MGKVLGKVFSALAVSVDGYITGRDPRPGHGLGDGGVLFDWYFSGDTPSRESDGFRLSEASRRVFDGQPFQGLPQHIQLDIAEVVPASGVTPIRYEVR